MTGAPHPVHLYPALPASAAMTLLAQRRGLTVDQLHGQSALKHPAAAPAASGGRPADDHLIRGVRDAVRNSASAAGYPTAPTDRTRLTFDLTCATALHRTMDIVPADAADEGVWTFLTMVVVPEITVWRFGDGAATERHLGRPRNTLRRLWWRAWSMGPDLTDTPDGCTPLGEDEYVQIMERTTLGGNQRTARAMRDAVWRAQRQGLTVARTDLMRRFALRVRARRSHISLDALEDASLRRLLDTLVAEAADDLR